jgi:hypothetical protein
MLNKMSLPTRKIGTSAVSAIGYGAMGIAWAYDNPLPDEERLEVYEIHNFAILYLDTLIDPRCRLCKRLHFLGYRRHIRG